MQFLTHFFTNVGGKLVAIFSTVQGWIGTLLLCICSYFAGHEFSVTAVIIAVVIDLIWGIWAAVIQKRFTLSELMRETISKMSVYGSALVLFVTIDKLLGSQSGLTVPIISSVIVMIETWSFAAAALIVFPDFPLLKLLQKVLTGEIANKLRIDPKDVEEYMNIRRSFRHIKKNEKKDDNQNLCTLHGRETDEDSR